MATQSSTSNSPNRRVQARAMFDSARQQVTTPRLAAAGAAVAGLAAYAFLRDPARREQIVATARDYRDRATQWWEGSSQSYSAPSSPTPSSAI